MKIIHICMLISICFVSHNYGQALSTNEALKLAETLNLTISDSIKLKFEKNKALLQFDDSNKNLDLRADYAIIQDSMSKKEKATKLYSSGRYIGAIFWQYDFESKTSSKSSFKANNSGKLFLTFNFQENDTIAINSSLNEYTSHHKTLDSSAHKVEWSGDKYISVLLQPEKIKDTIKFVVRGITISGKFERKDQQPIHKNYSKTLREILKREFKKAFDETVLITNNKSFTVYKATDLKSE